MKIEQAVTVLYSTAQMYDLVNNAKDYPDSLPWCIKTEVISQTETEQESTLFISYLGFTQQVTTRNHMIPNEKIAIHLVRGPFRKLDGFWLFKPDSSGCRIEFYMDYEFINPLFDLIAGSVFNQITHSLVEAFLTEAKKRFG